MKNFAIGCFVVLLVAAVAGGGIAYFKVIKPGMEMAGSFIQIGQELESLNKQVDNQRNFSPPADNMLDEQQLQQIELEMAGRFEELKAKYEDLESQLKADGSTAGLGDILGAYGDLGGLLIDGKRAQIKALNDHGFSLGEYAWVRDQAYRALGESVAVASFGNSGVQTDFKATIPQETRDMIEPHREALMRSLVIAWWGL
jgi:hypothetical protein